MKKLLATFMGEENGQGLVEYALILMLVVFAVFVSIGALGGKLGPIFTKVGETIICN